MSGNLPSEGRVEVCVNNSWGTVCDDSWGVQEAIVVCRQAGFSDEGAIALSRATFGQGTGDIVLDDVACIGTETMLTDCPFNSIHNCAHTEDAGVRCQQCNYSYNITITTSAYGITQPVCDN